MATAHDSDNYTISPAKPSPACGSHKAGRSRLAAQQRLQVGNHPPVQPLILLHQPLKLSCVVALLCMRRGRCSPCGCPLLLACSCCSGQQLAQLCTSACVAQEVWRAGVGSALMQDYGTLAGASRGVMCSRGVGVQAAEVYKARGVQWTLMLMWRLKG